MENSHARYLNDRSIYMKNGEKNYSLLQYLAEVCMNWISIGLEKISKKKFKFYARQILRQQSTKELTKSQRDGENMTNRVSHSHPSQHIAFIFDARVYDVLNTFHLFSFIRFSSSILQDSIDYFSRRYIKSGIEKKEKKQNEPSV